MAKSLVKGDIHNWLVVTSSTEENKEDLLNFYNFLADQNKERLEFSSNHQYKIEGEVDNYHGSGEGEIRTSPIKEIIREKDAYYVTTIRESIYRIQHHRMDPILAQSLEEYCEHGKVSAFPKPRYEF